MNCKAFFYLVKGREGLQGDWVNFFGVELRQTTLTCAAGLS